MTPLLFEEHFCEPMFKTPMLSLRCIVVIVRSERYSQSHSGELVLWDTQDPCVKLISIWFHTVLSDASFVGLDDLPFERGLVL